MVCGIPKKIIQRYFFKFKVPLRYNDINKLIETCATDYDVVSFPKRYTADSIVAIKRSLEDCRKNEGIITKTAAEAESNLLEAAADMGDSTAIALLCGARMRAPDTTEEEMNSGSDLLKQLMDRKFPLAFKVSGDLAYLMGHSSQALKFYEMALDNGLEDQRLVVECLRNMGHIQFKYFRLIEARSSFSRACMLAEDTKQVSDCHFLLAQLRESDRMASRRHLEIAAANGLHDAFPILGNLLLNWFGEGVAAREWFKLAITTDRTGQSLVGLLDAANQLGDEDLAYSTLKKIEHHPESQLLIESRKDLINNLLARKKKLTQTEGKTEGKAETAPPTRSGRFDF